MDYWESYRKLDETPTGTQLTIMRCDMVARHYDGELVDIGIGGGRFASCRAYTRGFDVNPCAVAWLKLHKRWADPYAQPVDAVTCWDSLEHLPDPALLLANVRRWCFVSIPIFRDLAHLLSSKHYKKSEHFLYATDQGFRTIMERMGWQCVESNDDETKAGREDIRSYAFRRVA